MADYLRWDAHNFLHSDAYFHPADFQVAQPPADSPDCRSPERPPVSDTDVRCPQTDSLRGQVLSIIASVLEDTDPACASARSQLRSCLAHNAGSPEKALLEHLVSLHGSGLDPDELHGSEPKGEPQEPRS
jgi:hypothetical protein